MMQENCYPIVNRIYAHNGDSWSTPASTVEACWSALGADADGLALNIFLSSDHIPVCAPQANLMASCGVDIAIADLTAQELQQYDAGKTFRSTQLDTEGQATGIRGEDTPWQALQQEYPLKDRQAVVHPTLENLLQLFARRTPITLILPDQNDSSPALIEVLIEALITLLERYGLTTRTIICGQKNQLQQVRARSSSAVLMLDCTADELSLQTVEQLRNLDCCRLQVALPQLETMQGIELAELMAIANTEDIHWRFVLPDMPWAPTADAIQKLSTLPCQIDGLLTGGVLPSVDALAPRSVIFEENFAGKQLDMTRWAAGYSHINKETCITVDDALIISIDEGKTYSGGAAIAKLPIHGDFDACVEFHVEHPHQATTFEIAAIAIDPGYTQLDNSDLDTRSVNLSFDVHGAPPYASSERDQDDGFRCGWNNSYNLTKFGDSKVTSKDAEWYAASSNMYNKYGRDVGDGSTNNLKGQLRLIRCGAIFNTYYRDKHNLEWVCSGSMLVQSMPDDCYLRLAAKHWHKIDPAPANVINFSNFSIRQY